MAFWALLGMDICIGLAGIFIGICFGTYAALRAIVLMGTEAYNNRHQEGA